RFVICQHQADQARCQLRPFQSWSMKANVAVLINVSLDFYLPSPPRKFFRSTANTWMFNSRDYDQLTGTSCQPKYCQIIRLRAAAGEDELIGVHAACF